MPLPISHSLLGASIVALFYPKTDLRLIILFGLGAFLANAADLDFIAVFLLGSKEWHRDFTHSILFAVLVFLMMLLATRFNKVKESVALGLAFASHLVLDFATTQYGGKGVELFWFFSAERYKLNWFSLSEMPSKMSPMELLTSAIVEIVIFTPILIFAVYLRNKRLAIKP